MAIVKSLEIELKISKLRFHLDFGKIRNIQKINNDLCKS